MWGINRGSGSKATLLDSKNKQYVKISTIVSFQLNNKQNISYLNLCKILQVNITKYIYAYY